MPVMERRKFGNTDLEVSAISLGCWPFGVDWWGHYSDDAAIALCRFGFDRGVTFFDNGDAYGNGRAETIFGKFLKGSGIARDKVEIGGKIGLDFYSHPRTPLAHKKRQQEFFPPVIRTAFEERCKRLRVDH